MMNLRAMGALCAFSLFAASAIGQVSTASLTGLI
jgi:hypothetical protein